MPPTPPVTRTTLRLPMLFSLRPKKNPRGRLGFEPLSGKAIKEEETLRQAYLRLAGCDAATPASVKDATFLAALVKLSKAAVAAASCDLIAATAMSPPAGADLAASSTVSVIACWKSAM